MAVLRILISRSLLLWAIPVWVGLYTAAMLSRGAPWRGDPAWGIEVVGVFVMFAGTVLAAMTAWEAATRDRHLRSLNQMAHRGRWHLVLRVTVGWALAVAVYLLAIVVVLVASKLSPLAVNNVSLVPVLTGSAALLAAAAWGAAIGTRISNVYAPVLAGVSFLVLEYLDYGGLLPLGLAEEGATATLLGVRYPATHFFVRIVWLAAFIAACLAVAWASRNWVRQAVAAALVLLTLTLAALPASTKEAYVADQYLDPSACTRGEVTVCVIPEWSSRLPVLESVATATQAVLKRETSVSLKNRYVGWTPGSKPTENTVDVISLDFAAHPSQTGEIVQDLVSPLGCADWHNPDVIPPDDAFAGRTLLSAWVLAQPELVQITNTSSEMPHALATLPENERQKFLTEVAQGLMNCRLGAIPALPSA